jgi:hypothetical protein
MQHGTKTSKQNEQGMSLVAVAVPWQITFALADNMNTISEAHPEHNIFKPYNIFTYIYLCYYAKFGTFSSNFAPGVRS